MKMTGKIGLLKFWLLLTCLYCLTVTIIEFHGVPIADFYSFRTTGFQYLTVCVCTSGLLLLISSNKWLFAATIPLLALVSGVMCYFRLSIGTLLTPVAIELAMINDASMWWSMISMPLASVALLSLAAGTTLALIRWKYVDNRFSAAAFAVGLILVLVPTVLVTRLSAPVGGRLPYSIYYSVKGYLENKKTIEEDRNNYSGVEALADSVPPTVIFILGESLRADHLPFNGYERNTMPLISQDSSLISFPNLYTEYTYTDVSVPHILTAADSVNPDRAYSEQSFITLFRNAGYTTAWFANQDLSRSYTYFAHEADTLVYGNADRSFYSYEKWLDADMLPAISDWLGKNDGAKLAIVHPIGSHWWYKSHHTDSQAIFKPEINHKDVGGLSKEQMINSYDNTIIATDSFVYSIFELVKDRNAVVIYVSDHGEGLGEEGVFLHAGDVEPLHRPACFFLFTDSYMNRYADKVQALKANSGKAYTTDAVFHTVLDLGAISSPALNETQSMAYDEKN